MTVGDGDKPGAMLGSQEARWTVILFSRSYTLPSVIGGSCPFTVGPLGVCEPGSQGGRPLCVGASAMATVLTEDELPVDGG